MPRLEPLTGDTMREDGADDLIQRLRRTPLQYCKGVEADSFMDEAADALEACQAEVTALQVALALAGPSRVTGRTILGTMPDQAIVRLMPLAHDERHLTAFGIRLKRGFARIRAALSSPVQKDPQS